MIKDLKKEFRAGVLKLLEDLVLEQDKLKFIRKLGEFTAKVSDLRLKVTNEHLDPQEFSRQEVIDGIFEANQRIQDIDDLRGL